MAKGPSHRDIVIGRCRDFREAMIAHRDMIQRMAEDGIIPAARAEAEVDSANRAIAAVDETIAVLEAGR